MHHEDENGENEAFVCENGETEAFACVKMRMVRKGPHAA